MYIHVYAYICIYIPICKGYALAWSCLDEGLLAVGHVNELSLAFSLFIPCSSLSPSTLPLCLSLSLPLSL